MPLIREEVIDFVDSWNNHKVRKQRNRVNHPTGRPFMLYFHPPDGMDNFRYKVEQSNLDHIKKEQSTKLHSQSEVWLFLYAILCCVRLTTWIPATSAASCYGLLRPQSNYLPSLDNIISITGTT